jgi:arylformamidase
MKQLAPTRGPLVWRDMDQNALDDAYDQAVYAPNRDLVLARIAAESERVRKILKPQRAAYGPSEHEGLDVYRAASVDGAPAPIHIFVHGGGWQVGSAADTAFTAEPMVGAGAAAVVIDFTTVNAAGGDLAPLARQVSRALAFVWRNAESFGGDRNRLYVSAHSSGAHLAACALSRGWREEGLPADFCKGAVLTGGMYDLKPVRLSKRSRYVKFTDQMEQDLSPLHHLDGIMTPLILGYGTCETPEFQRQTRDFFAALTVKAKPAEIIVAENYNHFELFETFANPYGIIGRERLRQMGLT